MSGINWQTTNHGAPLKMAREWKDFYSCLYDTQSLQHYMTFLHEFSIFFVLAMTV